MLFTDNYDKLNRAGGVTLAVDIIMVETRVRKLKVDIRDTPCYVCQRLMALSNANQYDSRYYCDRHVLIVEAEVTEYGTLLSERGIMLTDFKIK